MATHLTLLGYIDAKVTRGLLSRAEQGALLGSRVLMLVMLLMLGLLRELVQVHR